VDLDGPPPDLEIADHYRTAVVVARRGGVPVAMVDIDLTRDAPLRDQLAWVAAEVGGRPDHPVPDPITDELLPSISVVVPTIVARVEDLELLLDGFAALVYPDVEFILVDNRRELPDPDPLPGLIADRTGVRVVREPRPGISAARNAGLAAARGQIIAFTDDDVRVEPQWLRAIGRRFAADPALDAVTGLILPAELETPAQIWFERYYGGFSGERTFAPLTLKGIGSGPLRGSQVQVRDADGAILRQFAVYGVGAYGAGANMAFRVDTLRRLGGFDLALGTGTPARGGEDLATLIDVLWSGGTVGYEPAAVVHHRHRREVPELIRQLQGNGLGFTAMLTSLVTHHPRHLLTLGAQVPLAAWRFSKQSATRLRGRRPTDADAHRQAGEQFPRKLVTSELRGYPRGPGAYLKSRRAARAWTPSGATR